ncbi:MAG TPA: MraY family glycosyltransferase [Armatimonadota bacterium]|jgi:UDP-GlcNAc:undecaprenyl-phosphate GlcNAc-1-phosphate transferase
MINLVHCLVAFGLALFGAYLLTPVVEQVARRANVIRKPRLRDVHTRDMPLWGGIAIVVSVLFAFILTIPLRGQHQDKVIGIVLASLIVAGFGIADDKYDLSALVQLCALLLAGWVVTLFGVRIAFISHPFGPGTIDLDNLHLSVPITMLWVFFVTKATDIIDGVDGLAAGVSAISLATLAALSLLTGNIVGAVMAATVSGSAIGFLRHNFNPARIFMGTVGAQFLGFMLAALSVLCLTKITTIVTLSVSVMVIGVPLMDAVFVTIRRIVTMQPISKADKGHVHHRLLRSGLSQRETVYVLYTVTLLLCLSAVGVYVVTHR